MDDGVNDKISNREFRDFVLSRNYQIYNRWGRLVYESEQYKNDWDDK